MADSPMTDRPLLFRIIHASARFSSGVVKDAVMLSIDLYKIMVPIIILVKVLTELNVIEWLSSILSPVMSLVGLPGAMGLVWATTLVTNLYAGMVVFVGLLPDYPVTVAGATVLTTMMLIAHGIPVELQIARRAGARPLAMGTIRIGSAILLGFILSRIYAATGTLSETVTLAWTPPATDPTFAGWAVGQVQNLAMIFLIILTLMVMMRTLDALGISKLLQKLLSPVLRLLGIGPEAATTTVIGMALGITYGGGLIIREAESGRVPLIDIFGALTLMGLAHSLIEDTLLMMLMGGHLSGIFWGRLGFALLFVGILVRVIRWRGDDFFHKYFALAKRVNQ